VALVLVMIWLAPRKLFRGIHHGHSHEDHVEDHHVEDVIDARF